MKVSQHRSRGLLAVLLSAIMALAACGGGSPTAPSGGSTAGGDFAARPNCTPVYAAVSSEKVNLIAALNDAFQQSEQAGVLPRCADVVPSNVSSGESARLLSLGWPTDQTDKPQPAIWAPASTNWTDRLAGSKGDSLVPDPVSFARSPLVFAMPEQMARQLGWPDTPVGYKTLHDLCLDPQGWGKFGGSTALWGKFKLAKTSPNTSTTGLNTLLGQSHAATGNQGVLTEADVAASKQFSQEFESCAIHYGDTTSNVLGQFFERDKDGRALEYVSAVTVEETSVVNYNIGNPKSEVITDGRLPDGTPVAPPQKKLVAVYPAEGSAVSNNPLVVLGSDATWITPEQRQAADAFKAFVTTPAAQALLDDYGFRPLDPAAPVNGLITPENGVNPAGPAVSLPNPPLSVTLAAQQMWDEIRRSSRVLLVMDVSGSMREPAGTGRSRMEEAKSSAIATLSHFRPSDELGVWAFTTEAVASGDIIAEIHPVASGPRESLGREIGNLEPKNGTPLYDATLRAYEFMKASAKPGSINAIVLLTDGKDEGSRLLLEQLTEKLRSDKPAEGGPVEAPVRIFPIAYSQDAATGPLNDIAVASGGQVFVATDPRRIGIEFQRVVSNF